MAPVDYRITGEHRVLWLFGKGGKELTVPLHLEAVERMNHWIATAAIADDREGPLFHPLASSHGGAPTDSAQTG